MSEQILTRKAVPPEEAPHGFRSVYCTNCGYMVEVPLTCNDKTCEPCQRRKAQQNFMKMKHQARDVKTPPGYNWKHVVLTQLVSRDIRHGAREITRKFTRMRHRKMWKEHVFGGYYTVEAKRSSRCEAWHVHIHAVVLSRKFSYSKMIALWGKVNKAKFANLHVSELHKSNKTGNILSYICGYLTKKAQIPPELEEEYKEGLKGIRLISAFGKFHAQTVGHKKVNHTKTYPCPTCGCTEWVERGSMNREMGTGGTKDPPEVLEEWNPQLLEQVLLRNAHSAA